MQPIPRTLARDLARAGAHPHDPDAARSLSVEWVQTHLSHVFLTPTRVYKLRKSVSLGFVDFSTRARRNTDCREEVRLNRRLAPDVYLGIAPVVQRGGRFAVGPLDARATRTTEAREHVVVMRRLPDGCDALALLARGAFGDAEVQAVAERLARFHAAHSLGRPSPWSRAAWLARVQAPALDNLRLLEHEAGRLFPRALWERALAAATAFAESHRDAFERRRRAGRAVDGHGDVHLAHVWFEPDHAEPTLVDCIEFNPELRRIDAAAEVAFLAMDLAYRRRARLAARFLSHYAEAADDTDLFSVVDYFVSYRAAVRAKVAALAAADPSIAAAQRRAAASSARRHLAFAVRALRPRSAGALVLVAGTVGSGKTTAARVVADALGGVSIASDALRKRSAGLDPTDRSAARRGLYRAVAKDAVYRGLLERAVPVVRSGRVAVLDATWARPRHRAAAVRLARRERIPIWIVETRVPVAVARRRLDRRAAANRSASDAGPERLAASRAEFAPIAASRGLPCQRVRTDRKGWRAELRRAARRFAARAGLAYLALVALAPLATAQGERLLPGDHEIAVEHGGRTRRALVHVPPQATLHAALPVVVAYHGGGGSPAQHRDWIGLDALADGSGFVALYPAGTGRLDERLLTWNAGACCGYAAREKVDDVGATFALLGALAQRVPLDATRVYATGMSNGAMMAQRLAHDAGERVAAIATVAGVAVFAPFEAAFAMPILHLHSADDPRAPWDGGRGPRLPFGTRVTHPAVSVALDAWVARNGCPKLPIRGEVRRSADGAHSATLLRYAPCESGAPIEVWKLTGAGHVWPGAAALRIGQSLLGAATQVVSANELAWDFLRRFVRAGAPILAPAKAPEALPAAAAPRL